MNLLFPPLKLPADADERAVKRAYAAALKETRPDDDAQAFQRLVRARDNALEWVRRRPPVDTDASSEPDRQHVIVWERIDADAEAGAEGGPSPRDHASSGPVVSVIATPDAPDPLDYPVVFDLRDVIDRMHRTDADGPDKSGDPMVRSTLDVPPAADPAGPDLTFALDVAGPSAAAADDAAEPVVVHRMTPPPSPDLCPPPLPAANELEPVDLLRSQKLTTRFLIDLSARLIAGDAVTSVARWRDLLSAAEELDIQGRLALERAIAFQLDEAMRSTYRLDPMATTHLAEVVASIDQAFGWSNDIRRLIRILGEPSGAHPLVFAVERFGANAPRIAYAEDGFPLIPPGDLEAYFGKPNHPAIRAYRRAIANHSFGLSWSWTAFVLPVGWAMHAGLPVTAIGACLATIAAVNLLFIPIANVGAANAFCTFLVALTMTRIALAIAAQPIEIRRLLRIAGAIDQLMPPTTAERRRLIAATRGGRGAQWANAVVGLAFLIAVDGYAAALIVTGLELPDRRIAELIGPGDRDVALTPVTFAERLVARSYLDKAAVLATSARELAQQAPQLPFLRDDIEQVLAEVRSALRTIPIGDYAPRFEALKKRIAVLSVGKLVKSR